MTHRIVFAGLLFMLLTCERSTTENVSVTAAMPLDTKNSAEPPSLWVYIDDGAVQCEKPARPLSETQRRLTIAGIESMESRCGTITGTMMMTLCGTKDLNIHLHKILHTKLEKARSLGFESVQNMGHGGNKSYKFTDCQT